ncbi:TetR/AcrR family transcriptional regulator [Actinoplanes couchii]|uniref:TetR family transcriptional regulator n=1 Tax=Actinoplanes couchii TaxID=403638 RepID=A0ABQ3XP29_9ACTN|nr:TetR/AcrR family transcriptional regulator [Actinoplanes couchii]MDR6318661.1 AcrR family transcriptional regulator [Actinoplanes couchii]GID60268.1 TetR family transcriptional regulator [Actinoplanes couchii]
MPEEIDRPLRRDAQLNRERIVEAAREVFATRGLAATLDDVATHAGVGIGTVYRRFPTKEQLLEVAFEERLEQHAREIEAALRKPTGWDGLVSFLTRAAELHATDRGVRDIALGADLDARYFEIIRQRIYPLVEAIIDRAHAEGSLRADVTAGDVPLLLMMVSEVAHHSQAVRPEIFHRYLRLLIDGLRGDSDLGPPLTRPEVDALTRDWLPSGKPQR